MFAKLPDWLIYLLVVVVMVLVARGRREDADAPPAPPPPDPLEGELIGPPTPFDPTVVVTAPQIAEGPVAGTAFALSDAGEWLTARHVIEGCTRAAVLVSPERAVAARVRTTPGTDVALLTTEGGPPPLPLALDRPLRVGQRAFHPGFPQGRPGEVTTRLLGRETLRVRGRGARAEPVLAWAEVGRTADLTGALSGLSGAPALDAQGRVLGVTVAEAPRRGRIYTAAPESVVEAVRASTARRVAGARGEPLTVENYGRAADALRRDLRVAQVVCLQS